MRGLFCFLVSFACLSAQNTAGLGESARRYLVDLIRIDTSNPPGHESRVAKYLQQAVTSNGISCELLGNDPNRLNFVARLSAQSHSSERPLLLMAHSDVVPADRSQWTVPPFAAQLQNGFLYGRGAQDDKSLLASELAVLIELKRRALPLRRDVILLSEADEEAGSTGITWLIHNAYSKIDAEFALNEGGASVDVHNGPRIFQIQTSEKIPTRVVLTAKGTAGHGSLPRPDNPVVHLARAVVRIADADEPVKLNATTSRYFEEMSKLDEYSWLKRFLPGLDDGGVSAINAANRIRERDPELNAMLRTTVSPTMLQAGFKVNVIPNTAVAQVDVRRLPNETREEVETRFRNWINDPSVEVSREQGQDMPSTEPSSLSTALYQAMETVFARAVPGAVVVPFMSRGATDGSFLRQKGMAVYGVPVFMREGESRAHGNDERISPTNLASGTELLWKVVHAVAVGN